MIHDGEYRLSEKDGFRLLRLIGQLGEAVAELLTHNYTIIPEEDREEMPEIAELTFYELASNILYTED